MVCKWFYLLEHGCDGIIFESEVDFIILTVISFFIDYFKNSCFSHLPSTFSSPSSKCTVTILIKFYRYIPLFIFLCLNLIIFNPIKLSFNISNELLSEPFKWGLCKED